MKEDTNNTPRGTNEDALAVRRHRQRMKWVTRLTLSALSVATPWARIAIASAQQMRPHAGREPSKAVEEANAMKEVGTTPGRDPLFTPNVERLGRDGSTTPRLLVEKANEGVLKLQEALAHDTSDLAEYYRE